MEQTYDMETGIREKTGLRLQEFCDMNQLYRLLDNWSKSCGMHDDRGCSKIIEQKGLARWYALVRSNPAANS